MLGSPILQQNFSYNLMRRWSCVSVGKGSPLHAILLLGRMRKAIARVEEQQLSWGWQPSLGTSTAHQGEALFSCKPHISLCTCQAKVAIIQTCISVNKTSKQARNIMSFLVCFTEESRGFLAPRDTFFYIFFFFGFHCHFSSVGRGRHCGSSCICFHYFQEENFHFPTELKAQGPAQFPSIISESFSHDHILSRRV